MEALQSRVSFVLYYDPKLIARRISDASGNKPFVIVDLKELMPYQTYILIVLDYFGMYIPTLWLGRFHYLKNIIQENGWKKNGRVVEDENWKIIDLTDDLHNCFYKVQESLDFSFFHECVFYIFQGYTSFIHFRQRQMIRFLMPFIEFLSPYPAEVETWRRKSQNGSVFLLSDLTS